MGGQGRGGRPCRRLWRPRGRRGRRGRRWAEEGKVESRCGRRTHTLERRHCFHATSPSPAPISPHPPPVSPFCFFATPSPASSRCTHRTSHRQQESEYGAYMRPTAGDAAPAPRSSILADLAGTRLTSRLRAGQSVSGTEYRTTVPAYQHRTCVVRSFVPQPHPPTYATGVDIHSETLGTDVFVQTRHYRSMRRLRNSSTAETLLYPHHECCRSSLLLDTVCSTMQ